MSDIQLSRTGKALRLIMEEGITAKEAAERVGISRAAVSKGKLHPSKAQQNIRIISEMQDEIESLRQQLAEKDAENKLLHERHRADNETLSEKDAEIAKLRSDYLSADSQAFDSWQQLAAIQLQNTRLREALGFAEDCWFCEQTLTESVLTKMRHAIALPTDTSALEALIAKAGEVMRERCMTQAVAGGIYAFSIRALPGVTLGDLK